jgi:TetR/AcrR family transcriptional regulator
MPRAGGEADTRERILDVAEAQFGAKGYSGANLQGIAEAVGVQKTALYYYFASKEALYTAVLERILAELERVVQQLVRRREPTVENLERALDDLNTVLAHHPNYARILIRIFVDRVEIDASALEPTVERILIPLLRTYAAGVERGAFRKLSSRHVLLSVLGAAVFYYAAPDTSRDILGVKDVFDEDSVSWRARELRSLLLGGILPRDEEH